MQASVRCLGKFGKLLEIGKYDILKGTPLSMKPLLQNVQFIGIDLDRVATGSDDREARDSSLDNFLPAAERGCSQSCPNFVRQKCNCNECFNMMCNIKTLHSC